MAKKSLVDGTTGDGTGLGLDGQSSVGVQVTPDSGSAGTVAAPVIAPDNLVSVGGVVQGALQAILQAPAAIVTDPGPSIATELGAAASYVLLDLGGGGTFTDGKSQITGNVALADNTTWAEGGQSTITGNVTHGTPFNVSSSGTTKVSGSITLDESGVTKAASDAIAASNYFKSLTATLTASAFNNGNLTGGTTTINGGVGLNVVYLSSLTLSGGATLVLNGPPGAEFVINVSGAINLSNGSIVETGGITASDVVINETGSSDVSITGTTHTQIDAVVLAPTSNILVDGEITGEVIGGQGKTITMQSGVTLNRPVCFMAGTLILAASGAQVPIEDLAAGDLVLTADGRQAPILWVGRQSVSKTFADPLRALPIRISAGALGEALPKRDLLVSPCHALLVDDVLVQAGALVNGSSIVREANVPETFVYYHLELADHALILAEGCAAETFIDNASRMAFDNWAEHEVLFPRGRTVEELPQARVQSARQLPRVIRERLAARAAFIVPPVSEAA